MNRRLFTALELVPVSILGAALFLWPFVAGGAPAAAVVLAITTGMVVVLAAVEAGTRRLDARRFALLVTVAAIDAALRLVLVIGVEGFTPFFFLVLVAGYVYGPSFGFLCGATSLLASAVATGGIGPWLPYEAIACGWVGMVAGFAGLPRRGAAGWGDVAVLAVVGAVTGFAYGALLDVWDWTTFYRGAAGFGFVPGLPPLDLVRRFADFYAVTSFVYDSFRAAGNAVLIVLLGLPVITALARVRDRFTVTILPDLAT